MADPLHLMRLHVEALFTRDASGSLLRVNEPDGSPAPRFFLGITRHGAVRRYRHDVDDDLRRALEAVSLNEYALNAPLETTRYEQILNRVAPVERKWTGAAFSFPDTIPTSNDAVAIDSSNSRLLAESLDAWIGDVESCQPVVAIVVDGRAVSLCGSVRRTTAAHEAGVETAAAYRGHGLAARAVSAWAVAVRVLARVPLYSTSWSNEPSRSVARKLGLIQFGNDLHIT